MKKSKIEELKKILLKEKNEILNSLNNINSEFNTNIKNEIEELSVYDNHPGDIATETYQMEMNYALDSHKKEQLKNVEEALIKIDENKYGICEICVINITEERLEFLPSTKLCSKCADKRIASNVINKDRPIEEEVLLNSYRLDNHTTSYSWEDTWQDIQQHSTSGEIDDLVEPKGVVEKIEEISNKEYKNQLSD